MLLDSFFFSRRTARPATTGAAHGARTAQPTDSTGQLAYPPVDPGIAVRSADEILHAHDELIRRIKLSYGADHDTFSNDLLAVMQRYARYVNLLPATPDNYFSGVGGLLRMGLEIAFYALQATDGQIFSGRATISNRRQLEPRWRQATFIAGLCSELHRTLSHLRVTTANGNEWSPYLMPLTDWLQQQRADRFSVRWLPNAQETRSLAVFALPHILPAERLHHLAHGNAVVVPHLMASVTGMPVYRDQNIVDQLVRHAAALVIERDLQVRADRAGKPLRGSHLEQHLMDALRRLVQSNSGWMPNTERSRVWYGQDGLYIVWPNSVLDVTRLLEADRLPGIPTSPDTILEILMETGVIVPCGQTQATWLIYPANDKTPIETVKLASPAVLLAHLATAVPPLPYALAAPRPQPTASCSPAKPKAASAQHPFPGTVHADEAVIAEPARPDSDAPPPAVHDAKVDRLHHTPSVRAATSPPACAFAAPMRLNPAVRAALSGIVDSLNRDTACACCRIAAGLFVPLAELERRQIDAALAIRALSDLSMLVTHAPDNVKTRTHDVGGRAQLGIVIAPQYIRGFDSVDFVTRPSSAGTSHAGP